MDDRMILKYMNGQLSSEEKREMLDWINVSDDNRDYYRKMRELWDLSILTDKYDHIDNEEAYNNINNKIAELHEYKGSEKKRFVRIISAFGKVAAIVAIVFLASQYYFKNQEGQLYSGYNKIEVPIGARTKVILPDSSIVWLNSGTKISYPEKFSGNKRIVSLNGEARFEISENREKPFIVNTPMHSITVLGTTFNVYAYDESNHFETTLLEGSIILKNNSEKKILKMEPGQQVVYDKTTQKMTVHNDIDIKGSSSWISDYYSFDKIKFDEMLERLGKYYNKKVIINRPEIAAYECTGKFKVGEPLEHILNVVKVTKPFKYEINEHQIIIY
jgi:ferric-dicitrate binding protein FerR (iron transport regulator)